MKLLVVEDSMFVQNILKKNLAEYFPESEILVAGDGEKGYAQYIEHKPDLIMTDLLMPNMTGQELVKKIRIDDKETPIIVISADVQKAIKEEVEELGILNFISKPVIGEKVELLINNIREAQNVK